MWLVFPEPREAIVVTARSSRRVRGRAKVSAAGLPELELAADALFRQLAR